MYLKSLLLLAISCTVCSCNSTTQSEDKTEKTVSTVPVLEKLWETDTTLITPESVLFDAAKNLYYVSCIGGLPPELKDGDGYIAKISSTGEILENHWVTGLDAPKGLAMIGKTLFVTDIDMIVAIDTETGKVLSKQKVNGATFLNDADASPDGQLYITDSDQNTVYQVSQKSADPVLIDSTLGRLNGILLESGHSILAGFNSGKIFSVSSDQLTVLTDSIFSADGIEKYKDGYLISSWAGRVYHLSNGGNRTKLLDTESAGMNAADIEVVENQNILLVPTFLANKVVAYKIK